MVGRFLLVHFYIEDLCKYTTLRQVQQALKDLDSSLRVESSLNGIYKRAMDTIRQQHPSRRDLAQKVLAWLVKAKRTLTVPEIRLAIAIEKGAYEAHEADMPEDAMLVEVCVGLAIIDENSNTIQLAHYSVQEYLVRNSVDPNSAELELTTTCLTLLSFKAFTKPCITETELDARIRLHPL